VSSESRGDVMETEYTGPMDSRVMCEKEFRKTQRL
jgi:hypothetical protein